MRRLPIALCLALAACGGADRNVPGDARDHGAFNEIAPQELLRFTGTEPFWGGEVSGERLLYRTPEDQAGQPVAVTRFAGRGGLSFSGTLAGAPLLLAVTPGQCSDGMSDRIYPFVVTLRIGDEPERQGCGWSEAHPFSGPEAP